MLNIRICLHGALLVALSAAAVSAAPQGPTRADRRLESRPARGFSSVMDEVSAARPRRLDGQLTPTLSLFSGRGITRTQNGLYGAGPGYAVQFHDDGISFTPALGKEAPDAMPMRVRVQSVTRRDASTRGFATDSVAPCSCDGDLTADYHRRGYKEIYETREDGIKQSFVFSELPPGSGDLVVRLDVQTELPLASAAPDALRFENPGIGGVEIRDVIGIDAHNRRVEGSMIYTDGELELVLPAAFVDDAALPLVLDPLFAGIFSFGASNQSEEYPDVAYDQSTDMYLVVWRRAFAWGDGSIMGQRFRPNGVVQGPVITISPRAYAPLAMPRVANINLRNSFVVTWEQDYPANVFATAVSASTSGPVWPAIPVAAGPLQEWRPVVAGDAGLTDDDALIFWYDRATSSIRGVQFEVPAFAPPRLSGTTRTLASGREYVGVEVSKQTDSSGRHLVLWHDGSNAQRVQATVIDRNLNQLTTPFFVQSSIYPVNWYAVDGNGTRWVVAYEQTTASGDSDIYAKPIEFDPATQSRYIGLPAAVEADANDPERWPTVAWMGDSVLVGFSDRNGSNWDTYVKSIDPFDCGSCEGEFALDTGSRDSQFVRIGVQSGVRPQGNGALLVWRSRNRSNNDYDVKARRFVAADGFQFVQTNGCGQSGTVQATCAFSGNSSFDLRLTGAQPNSSTWLYTSTSYWTQPNPFCGGTLLTPEAVVFAGGTDARGNLRFETDIINDPALIGASFNLQWLMLRAPSIISSSDIVNVQVH